MSHSEPVQSNKMKLSTSLLAIATFNCTIDTFLCTLLDQGHVEGTRDPETQSVMPQEEACLPRRASKLMVDQDHEDENHENRDHILTKIWKDLYYMGINYEAKTFRR